MNTDSSSDSDYDSNCTDKNKRKIKEKKYKEFKTKKLDPDYRLKRRRLLTSTTASSSRLTNLKRINYKEDSDVEILNVFKSSTKNLDNDIDSVTEDSSKKVKKNGNLSNKSDKSNVLPQCAANYDNSFQVNSQSSKCEKENNSKIKNRERKSIKSRKSKKERNRIALKYKRIQDYSDDSESDVSNRKMLDVSVGDFVWAKLGSQRWWPAVVIWGSDCGQPPAGHNESWVFWCGDHKISEVPRNMLLEFIPHFNRKYNEFAGNKFERGIIEVLQELANRVNVNGTITKDPESLLKWAKDGFPNKCKKANPFSPSVDCPISEHIRKQLNRIKAQYLESVWTDKGISLIPRVSRNDQLVNENSALKKVREGVLKIEDICIACDTSCTDIVIQHPLIEGGLCKHCRDEIKETMFAYGDDGTNAYCVICGQAGELLICDNHECNRCYCTGCIEVLVSPGAHIKVRETNPWLCYMCSEYDSEQNGLIRKKDNWQQNIMFLFRHNQSVNLPPNMDDYKEKKAIRVLSLFDGIGTGKLVLEQLGIEVETYYASEIDQDAINISLVQHKGNIIHLGDIEDITDAEIGMLCPIDLVIGGSPCNDLALVNPLRKGLYDPSGTGKLFFDFFRVLRAVQMANKGRHLFWLYENVAAMPVEYKAIITRFLQCEPALIDSKYFTAQKRARYFWGNLPGMYTVQEYWSSAEIPNPCCQEELYNSSTLDTVLTPHLNRKAIIEKVGSITTHSNSLKQGKQALFPVSMNGEPDVLWITEIERIFGFPSHYTDVGNIQLSRRQQLLGKAWSVPVIRHLFTSLKNFFKTVAVFKSSEKARDEDILSD
ncbi:DNA (cytosine-5)-methyltransferase 3A-like isoform X2 [Centruroides vittatus]|uniref:DNA (cytosine-5)-methyltransferase 3A-like isoform X2 n=1 Tax=Centruroides vittatus TaxID=120091 RepID=UPI00351071B2